MRRGHVPSRSRREEVNDKLVEALMTPGTQLVVYGYSGSGKSTLLRNKLRQIYEREITTRCTSSTSFDQLMLSAFDDLDSYYVTEKSDKKNKLHLGVCTFDIGRY